MDKTVEVSQAARDAAAVREALGRKYLLLASYCDGENAPCTDARPCDACLAMCNVFRLAEHGMSFVGELGSALQSTTRATQPEAALREAVELARAHMAHTADCAQDDPISQTRPGICSCGTEDALAAVDAALKDHRHG